MDALVTAASGKFDWNRSRHLVCEPRVSGLYFFKVIFITDKSDRIFALTCGAWVLPEFYTCR